MSINLQKNIKEIKQSIVAIGFNPMNGSVPDNDKINIIGSGFIISEDGKMVSAAHLYRNLNQDQFNNLKANVMTGQIKDNLEFYKWMPIELITKDDKEDIALFKIKGGENESFKKIDLGDSENVEVGQDAYFIGFPYAAQLINEGFGVTLVVNKGIISNIKRDGVDPEHKRNWLIVDAISNPGNSGCPLIDAETNKVIGVMTIAFRTKSKTVENLDIREPMHIAGAKPINSVKNLLK